MNVCWFASAVYTQSLICGMTCKSAGLVRAAKAHIHNLLPGKIASASH